MFAQRRAGKTVARIARALNDAAVPCPSAADPDRNSHRSGGRWTLTSVGAILANPPTPAARSGTASAPTRN
ncbi:hypothetical protein [Streptomyces synnematoformans]|uniref:hypothetical protein n=1 Tax=Streptomyces synnematoformans TaxID=415721 RepID=UPI0031D473EF